MSKKNQCFITHTLPIPHVFVIGQKTNTTDSWGFTIFCHNFSNISWDKVKSPTHSIKKPIHRMFPGFLFFHKVNQHEYLIVRAHGFTFHKNTDFSPRSFYVCVSKFLTIFSFTFGSLQEI
jgi:hypothetical protein